MIRILLIFLGYISLTICFLNSPLAAQRDFSEFSLDLPEGWDGDERSGFTSGDRNEYMLVLGKKDPEGDHYLAHISLFFLPNKPGKTALESAKTLAQSQAEATEPTQEGVFWVFTGDPRDNVLKGRGKTRVAANEESLLIIIVKDPGQTGADSILDSLTPRSERAKKLLLSQNISEKK